MDENSRVDPSMRAVVNTNFDTNNIVSMDKSLPQIQTTLRRCQDILKEHCGPQSGYAMLVNNMSAGINFEPNVFTRDGIKILSSIEFLSPLERYIKDLLTYVGTRVDNTAKDGTTTSMLFSALFLEKILNCTDKIKSFNLTFFQMNKAIEQAFSTILQLIDKNKFTIEKILEKQPSEITEGERVLTAGKIAFMQALSSSGGNVELAIAMKEIFEKSPSIAWDFITSHNSIKETGKSFQVETSEYDTHFRCVTSQADVLNEALNTEFVAEDVTVLIISDLLSAGSFKTSAVLEYVKNFDTNKSLAIFCPYIDASFQSEITNLNQMRNKYISVWQYCAESRISGMNYPYELLITAAIAGALPFNQDNESDVVTDKHVFNATKLHWHDSYMDFFGIVETGDSTLHPYYADPSKSTEFYTQTKEAIEKQIAMYKDGHKPDGRMYGLFMEMLNKLACIHRPTLRLGGPAHEQIANADVVQDVQGAIMSSLKHGFFVDGVNSMLTNIQLAYKDVNNKAETLKGKDRDVAEFQKLILENMCEAMHNIREVVHGSVAWFSTDENGNFILPKADVYCNVLDGVPRHLGNYLDEIANFTSEDIETPKAIEIGTSYPVLQPVTITIELLKRIQELLMKFINTNKIVVYGGVVVNEENKNGGGKA